MIYIDLQGFREKNKQTQIQTINTLKQEKKQKLKELEILKNSEPKLINELQTMKENIITMNNEIVSFQDMDGLHRAFDMLKDRLISTKQGYVNRRDTIRQQVRECVEMRERGLDWV